MSEIKDWLEELKQKGIDQANKELAEFEERQKIKELKRLEKEYRETPMGKLETRIDQLEWDAQYDRELLQKVADKFNWDC